MPVSKFSNKEGFSLLELLLVVAVGSVIILAGLAVYRLTSNQQKVNEASTLVGNIVAQMESRFTVQTLSSYAAETDITNALVDMNIIPLKYVDSAGLVKNPWGGDIRILTAEAAASTNLYRLQFHSIPNESVCIRLSQIYDFENSQLFHSFRINGVVVDDLSLANVSALCRAEAYPIFNTIAVRL